MSRRLGGPIAIAALANGTLLASAALSRDARPRHFDPPYPRNAAPVEAICGVLTAVAGLAGRAVRPIRRAWAPGPTFSSHQCEASTRRVG